MIDSEPNADTPEKASSLHEVDSCCGVWLRAQQKGTDNEMYSSAIWDIGKGEWRIGCVEEDVKFCPWCGARKTAAID